MSWFRRSPPVEYSDPQMPPEVYAVKPEPLRNIVDFTEKPADLVRAASTLAWTRKEILEARLSEMGEPVPEASPSLTVPWSAAPPTEPGVYWVVEPDASSVRLCVVLSVGGRLCIRERAGDSCIYRSVAQFKRHWAGRLPIPEGMTLEELSP